MTNTAAIRAQIELAAREQMDLSPEVASNVAFHMTDWLDDLDRWAKFCTRPADYTSEQVGDLLLAFLQHVPNHVAAASKLYADMVVSDAFNVGAIQHTNT